MTKDMVSIRILKKILFLVIYFTVSNAFAQTQTTPICSIYDAPQRNLYAWYSCEDIPPYPGVCYYDLNTPNFISLCSISGNQCVGSYGVLVGVEDACSDIELAGICNHRKGCEWSGGACRNRSSVDSCRPVSSTEARVTFEALKDGTFACIFSASTPSFDPFTVDGTNFTLKVRAPSLDPSHPNIAHEFTQARKIEGTNRYEFHVKMTQAEVAAIRLRMANQASSSTDPVPQCEAWFENPQQSKGVSFHAEGGGLQCQCPEQFLRMLANNSNSQLVASGNQVSLVSDECAQGYYKRLSRLPYDKVSTSKLGMNTPYSCGRDFDPILRASYPEIDWNTCWSNTSVSSQYIEKTAGWLYACFDRMTTPTHSFVMKRDPDGGWYQEAVVEASRKTFTSYLEKDLGIFTFQYTMKQIEETQSMNAEHLRLARAIIQSADSNNWAAGRWNGYVPATTLAAAVQIYKNRETAESVWTLLPNTLWDMAQHGLNKAEIKAYLVNPRNPFVPESSHWPNHAVPNWKVHFFDLVCDGLPYCGIESRDLRLAYERIYSRLQQMMAAHEEANQKIKMQMPWIASIVDYIDSDAARRMYITYRENPTPEYALSDGRDLDWFKNLIRPRVLSYFRRQLAELEKLEANLMKLKAAITCPNPTNSLSSDDFKNTINALVELPAPPLETYKKCRASDLLNTPSGARPVCQSYEGRDAEGQFCYCEGVETQGSFAMRQVNRDQIWWRIRATDMVLSQRAWNNDLSALNSQIVATGVMAVTAALGPVTFRIGLTVALRAGAFAASMAETGVSLYEDARFLAYFARQPSMASKALDLARAAKVPAIEILKSSGIVLDTAIYTQAAGSLGGLALGLCDQGSPYLGDHTPVVTANGSARSVDLGLQNYLNCIRGVQHAVAALAFTGVIQKYSKAKVGDYPPPPNPEVRQVVQEVQAIVDPPPRPPAPQRQGISDLLKRTLAANEAEALVPELDALTRRLRPQTGKPNPLFTLVSDAVSTGLPTDLPTWGSFHELRFITDGRFGVALEITLSRLGSANVFRLKVEIPWLGTLDPNMVARFPELGSPRMLVGSEFFAFQDRVVNEIGNVNLLMMPPNSVMPTNKNSLASFMTGLMDGIGRRAAIRPPIQVAEISGTGNQNFNNIRLFHRMGLRVAMEQPPPPEFFLPENEAKLREFLNCNRGAGVNFSKSFLIAN